MIQGVDLIPPTETGNHLLKKPRNVLNFVGRTVNLDLVAPGGEANPIAAFQGKQICVIMAVERERINAGDRYLVGQDFFGQSVCHTPLENKKLSFPNIIRERE